MPRPEARQPQPPTRTILVAVAGGSPAVITETFWALAREKGVRIDEVRVITTSEGRDAVVGALLSSPRSRFSECCVECGLDPERVKFDGSTIEVLRDERGAELADIRDSRENALAADQICSLIHRWAGEEGTRLHASAAGGRKTMSIYLTIAMMLYGREEDSLWHVLVEPEEAERCGEFFHPYREPRMLPVRDRDGKVVKEISTADVRIDLAAIPFVRLSEIGASGAARQSSYLQIVKERQQRLRFLSGAVSVEILHAERPYSQVPLVISGRTCRLKPASGLIYALLAERCKRGAGGAGLRVKEITAEDLKRTYQLLTGNAYGALVEGTHFGFLPVWVKEIEERGKVKSQRKAEDDFDNLKSSVEQAVNRANKSLTRAGFPERFMIANVNRDKRRQPARYALRLPPEAIQLPD
ncbi:MAG: TIGR02584 family CRISPR-associated protein [Acidobacteria bacterium]|nr:TIGR02584 family CRISPR-associated protein [Acidobacteriota bacterium]